MKSKSDLLEFYRVWYEFEHERHLKLNASLSVLFALQTAVISAIVYIFDNLALGSFNWFGWIALLFCCTCIAIACHFSVRAYWGQTYEYLGSPKDLHDLYANHIDWIAYDPNEENLSKPVDDLLKRYVRCTNQNYYSNFDKSKRRHVAVGLLVVSIIGIVPAYTAFRLEKETSNVESSDTATSAASAAAD